MMTTEITEELEYMCFYIDPNCDDIKNYIMVNNININDEDFLRNVCISPDDKLFKSFLYELNANFLVNNMAILEFLASCGDIDKLQILMNFYRISTDEFVKKSNRSTILINKTTANYFIRKQNHYVG